MTSSQVWLIASVALYMAFMLGIGSWITLSLILPDGHPTHLFGFAVSIAVLVLVSLLTPAPRTAGKA